jgi:CheY-like chemotaxis protein
MPVAVLVDDNLMFASMVQPALQRLGYQVRSLPGGPAGAEAIEAAAPEVVFVNLGAARGAGAATVRALRERPALANTPIVGYAGHVERHLFEEGREAGATLVVPNSAMSRALPEVLEKVRRRAAGTPEAEWPEE